MGVALRFECHIKELDNKKNTVVDTPGDPPGSATGARLVRLSG